MREASIPVTEDDTPVERAVRWEDETFDLGFTMIPNAILLSAALSTSAFRVYALLLYYAREKAECWPGQEGLAERSGIGERTIRTAIRELEAAELLRTVRRGLGLTNLYLLLRPRSGSADTADPLRPDPPIPPYSKKKKLEVEERVALALVVDAWKASAPPLIPHREGLYTDSKTLTKIRAALRVYPADVVAEAIRLHAIVVGGAEYRWTYRWTLPEFLARGLDKFVPEADPLGNFRERGKAATTAADFPGLDVL